MLWRLMTVSSPISDRRFQEFFPHRILSRPLISSWLFRLCSSGSSRLITHRVFRHTPGRTPFHPCAVLPRPASRTHPLPATPFQCPRSRTAMLRRGQPLTSLTLAWLYIEPSPCGGERGDPVDNDPGAVFEDDPHPRSNAGRPLEPWVCRHTREPTVVQGELPPISPEYWPLSPTLPVPLGARLGQVRTVVPVPRGGHLPLQPARLFLLCVSLEVFATPTGRNQGKMLIHPSTPTCATPPLKRGSHTRRFGTLVSLPPPVIGMPWGPHPPGHQLSGDIKNLFQGEIFKILDNTLNSWEILSHECRRIYCRSHEHSPYYWMFVTWLCNVRHFFLSVSHLVFDSVHKYCCVTAHDEIFKICLFLVIHCLRFPRSIVNHLSVPSGMRIPAEKRFLTNEGQLFPMHPKTLPQVSPIDHHLQQIFQDLDIHARSSPGLMKLKKTRTKAFLRSNSSWVAIWLWHVLLLISLLSSFCHRCDASSRATMADIKQGQQMIPFIACEISLCQDVCELVFGVNVFDLDLQNRSINQSRETLWVLETSLIVGLLPLMIILISVSLSSTQTRKLLYARIWKNRIDFIHDIDFLMRLVVFVFITSQVSPFDLKYENYFQEHEQLDPIIPEEANHPISIPCPKRWFHLDSSTTTQMAKSWSNMEDPVVPLERNLHGHVRIANFLRVE